MKHTLTHFLAALAVLIAPFSISIAQVAPGAGDVLISEVSALNIAEDFLELFNNTSNAITLADCKLIRERANGTYHSLDFNFEGTGDIIIPANGVLVVAKNISEATFNTFWGVDLTNMGVNFNTGTINAIYNGAIYKLRYGGTAGVNDGTIIDQTFQVTGSNSRIFQAPIGVFNYEVGQTTANFTPGYFEISEDLSRWDIIYKHFTWHPSAPSATSGSKDVLIASTAASIPDGAIMNNLYITSGSNVAELTQDVTVNGNLTLEENSAYRMYYSSASLSVSGTSSVTVTGLGNTNGFNVWSSPFSSVDILSTFSGVNPCDVYVYQASSQAWKHDYVTNFSTTCNGTSVTFLSGNLINVSEGTPDGNFDIGRGYFAPGNPSPTRTISSSNDPSNGSISVPIYGSSVAIAGGNDWNLIGNPYIAGIAASTFVNQNSTLINAVYIYNGSTGAYETYNSASSFIIAIGQGFFVDANTTTDGLLGNVQFNNSQQRASYDTFRKGDNNGIDTTIAFLSINNSQNIKDQIQVYIAPDCQDGVDNKFDARKLMNDHNLNFASLIESDPIWGPEPYVFNGVKSLEDQESKVIDLFVQTDAPGKFEIKLDSLRDMPLGMSIVLEDKETSAMTNLRTEAYTFTSAVADTLENRFYLHLSYDASVTSLEDIVNVKQVSIYAQSDEINVKVLTNNVEISTVEVYTVLGKQMIHKNAKGVSAAVPTTNLSSGIYIVKVEDSNGTFYTERVFVK